MSRHLIELSEKQHQYLELDTPTKAFQGGAGSGKTRANVIWALTRALKYPGSVGMIVAPTYPMLEQAVEDHLFEVGDQLGLLEEWTWNRSSKRIELPNGSKFWMRSADNPSSVLGATLSWVAGDEVALWKKLTYSNLTSRLRQPGFPHQMGLTFTPKGKNWAHGKLSEERDRLGVITATSFDNPFLEDDYYVRLRDEYGEGSRLWQQEVLGQYVAWEGLIYQEWDADKHIVSTDPLGEQAQLIPGQFAQVVAGVDWGWENPGCILVLGLDANDILWVLEETYEQHRSPEWWADEAARLKAAWDIAAFYCDPSNPSNRSELNKREGVTALKAPNEVLPGIGAVAGRLSNGKLRVLSCCYNLIGEFLSYSWKQQSDGTIRKDEPAKEHDHATDALRYAVLGLLHPGRRAWF